MAYAPPPPPSPDDGMGGVPRVWGALPTTPPYPCIPLTTRVRQTTKLDQVLTDAPALAALLVLPSPQTPQPQIHLSAAALGLCMHSHRPQGYPRIKSQATYPRGGGGGQTTFVSDAYRTLYQELPF